uniref:DUF834 domain-containing protein n=1 Tax=Oryza sativa subsp. japonica TaxID=39947 RepID=Q84T24_ORYSJ|nr:hypothetical protein [Oryza sativa Japonica Group]
MARRTHRGPALRRTTTENGRRQGRGGGSIRVDGVGGSPAGFGGNGGVDGVLLAAANPKEVAATEGDDGSSGDGWSGWSGWSG